MSKPTKKSPEIEKFLEDLAGRTSAIVSRHCVQPPFGCGKVVTGFRDQLSAREYDISGLCQECQDRTFQTPEDL